MGPGGKEWQVGADSWVATIKPFKWVAGIWLGVRARYTLVLRLFYRPPHRHRPPLGANLKPSTVAISWFV